MRRFGLLFVGAMFLIVVGLHFACVKPKTSTSPTFAGFWGTNAPPTASATSTHTLTFTPTLTRTSTPVNTATPTRTLTPTPTATATSTP